MTNTTIKLFLLKLSLGLYIFIITPFSSIHAQNMKEKKLCSKYIDNPVIKITKGREYLFNIKKRIKNYYSDLFETISEKSFDSLIAVVSEELEAKPITISEKALIERKLFNRITYVDPHFRHFPLTKLKKGIKLKNTFFGVWPFSILYINGKAIIDKSFSPLLKKGDMILRIDEIPINTYLENTYKDRYMSSNTIQVYNHFCYKPSYDIVIKRNNKIISTKTKGIITSKMIKPSLNLKKLVYENHNAGYLRINSFENNKKIIKDIRNFCYSLKNNEIKNLIIDIRKNSGGSGDKFDRLFSLFINKDSLNYLKEAKAFISKTFCKYYKYPKDSIGKIVKLGDEICPHIVKLYPKKFITGINFWILISRNTASQAATFANVLQYNKAAKLIGEPLRHNALRYGDIVGGNWGGSIVEYSLIRYNEYTNAKNGILYPDISIPYKIEEYIKGGDPVLEKSLEYIGKRQ